ncbi:hypothetical protein [Fundidesulfovibrio putealis]|uniref:hypothetical protein n=1 Tax=Fundidesulfovibrio putealis TaxID=270496 RepID=UPI00041E20EE|nr:hypothetical protein [Fundidesulfovibrio putealis]
MRSKKTSFLAATALGVAVLAGSALPSQAQTTTVQPQGTIQTQATAQGVQGVLPDSVYTGWNWPTVLWPTTSATPGTVPVAPQATTSQPTAFWGCWWW